MVVGFSTKLQMHLVFLSVCLLFGAVPKAYCHSVVDQLQNEVLEPSLPLPEDDEMQQKHSLQPQPPQQDEEDEENDEEDDVGMRPVIRNNDNLSDDDLAHFLSQFVLIKTPYGYILGRTHPSEEASRFRRFSSSTQRHADSNFQLRVRKSGLRPYSSAQNNFQLRVRKNGPTYEDATKPELNVYDVLQMRARKAIWQEIRDRRRSAADHYNSNFQLRVRKSDSLRDRGFAHGPGHNFQLRVRRSPELLF